MEFHSYPSPPPPQTETRLHHFFPCLSVFTLITISSIRIHQSYCNGEITIIPFITFLCFVAFLLYYCFQLNQRIPPWKKSPKKDNLLFGIWLSMSCLMLGFCFKFAELTASSSVPISFSVTVIGGNMLVLYHYQSVWGEDNLRNSWVRSSRTVSIWVGEMEMGESAFV